jgi:hypothetical protein
MDCKALLRLRLLLLCRGGLLLFFLVFLRAG